MPNRFGGKQRQRRNLGKKKGEIEKGSGDFEFDEQEENGRANQKIESYRIRITNSKQERERVFWV